VSGKCHRHLFHGGSVKALLKLKKVKLALYKEAIKKKE